MNKVISILISVGIAIGGSTTVYASEPDNICQDAGIEFAFINGVQTTRREAAISLRYLKILYGSKVEKKEGESKIEYRLLYNQTHGLLDFVEVFEQRYLEALDNRYELFFASFNSGSSWLKILSDIGIVSEKAQQALKESYKDILTRFLLTPSTKEDYDTHKTLIDSWALEGKGILFFAHSQGNLFANVDYDYAISRPNLSTDSVKLIHVAPASIKLNGPYVLADEDIVIGGLRLTGTGSVPSSTHDIPKPWDRSFGINGKKDWMGHGLLEIYLNPTLSTSGAIMQYVQQALQSLQTPNASATSGLFTVTLTWDGEGDVDTHVFEPHGQHVYYANKSGNAGYLDYDNTIALGPEHYFASCNKHEVHTGIYSIKLANYKGAKGRKATVQISSNSKGHTGVLGTKSIIMGGETRDTPVFDVYNVLVSQDSKTGKFKVSIQ